MRRLAVVGGERDGEELVATFVAEVGVDAEEAGEEIVVCATAAAFDVNGPAGRTSLHAGTPLVGSTVEVSGLAGEGLSAIFPRRVPGMGLGGLVLLALVGSANVRRAG